MWWQDLPDTRGESQEYRRAAEEERTGCEDSGGHVRPKAEEWTFQVFFTALLHDSFVSYFHNNLDIFTWKICSLEPFREPFQWFIFRSLFICCDLCQVWAGVKGGVYKENRKTDWEWEQKQRWVFQWSSSYFLLFPVCWSCWRSYCFSVETARIQKESAVIDRKLEEHSRTCSELKRLQVNNPSSVNHFTHHWVIGTAFKSYQLT